MIFKPGSELIFQCLFNMLIIQASSEIRSGKSRASFNIANDQIQFHYILIKIAYYQQLVINSGATRYRNFIYSICTQQRLELSLNILGIWDWAIHTAASLYQTWKYYDFGMRYIAEFSIIWAQTIQLIKKTCFKLNKCQDDGQNVIKLISVFCGLLQATIFILTFGIMTKLSTLPIWTEQILSLGDTSN